MVVQLAKPRDVDPRKGPLYQIAPQPTAPQEKSAAGQITDMITDKAMSETVDYGATKLNENIIQPGLEKASAMFSPAAAAPTQAAINAAATSSGTAGPLMQQVMGQAAGNAATTTGMGAAMGTLGTAVPYIGAAMLAGKAFGLFSDGGHVGPLYASEGRKAVEGESIKDQLSPLLMDKFIEEQEKIQNEIEQSRYKYGGGMAGPLSKVEYKSAGGETYKLSYGGPISKGV